VKRGGIGALIGRKGGALLCPLASPIEKGKRAEVIMGYGGKVFWSYGPQPPGGVRHHETALTIP